MQRAPVPTGMARAETTIGNALALYWGIVQTQGPTGHRLRQIQQPQISEEMNSGFDLIVFKREQRLSAVRVAQSVSRSIFDNRTLHFHGLDYAEFKPFGEWLAICDDSRSLVGLAIVCVIQPDIIGAPFFRASNISKEGEDFRILFARSNNPQLDGWPFETVYTLKSCADDYILYIPDFYSVEQTVSLADNFATESLQGC
jgi:hypothetical protein